MVDARSVTIRPHPSHPAENTEGASSLLADEKTTELPVEPDDLELSNDVDVRVMAREEGDDVFEEEIAPDHGEPEVEDTPGDDALIAEARIERFNSAHDSTAPVDVGPFEEDKDR